MTQAAGPTNPATDNATKWKQYAGSASVRDLLADSPNGRTCARLIVMLAAGDLTHAYGPGGEAQDYPLTGLPSGYRHQGATSGVVSTVAFVAYW